ncbi:type I-C CRISPR-associated protein Cas7/Csd2 [Spirochaeta thermophila]|uniref:CRISPR-associated protein, Csd2 family n=1 Tax=Winmispira thermophila (strain ATCC 49972 / DSM 6192 / RI 19.B1) TaxID=665571 RepID=E0RPN8_WINT6|nr:type I-C CRISPR-associated protein Cas7/Csd2 [Spirochaeta thermophila]ADN01352.1 CRISPR-associated protein, Csd2 family [Spirochaeta thermophila DSM 6192]
MAITNRYDFLYIFDVENGNPNGDPDAGNMPRIDPETNLGWVTDVCLKRKVRNYVLIKHKDTPPYKIYVKEKAILNLLHKEALEEVGADLSSDKGRKGSREEVEKARKWMCEHYYDVRTFGAVMSTTYDCGQVRGPVQFSFARSVDPITPVEVSITRMAVTREEDAEKQQGDNRTMGRKHVVPYGLYVARGFVSAPLSQDTGFSDADLELLWEALCNMFEHDRSAARGVMSARKLIVFKHQSELGNAPAQKLFGAVSISRKDETAPPRSFEDYTISLNREVVPKEVEIIEML